MTVSRPISGGRYAAKTAHANRVEHEAAQTISRRREIAQFVRHYFEMCARMCHRDGRRCARRHSAGATRAAVRAPLTISTTDQPEA
jgi:hypothetical protein